MEEVTQGIKNQRNLTKKQYMRTLASICLIFLSLFLNAQNKQTVIVTNLKCENFSNPIGIDTTHPSFSWQLGSVTRNILQTAYQIIVSDDPDKLSDGSGNIWDSGKINSDQSIQVIYKGDKLQSAKKYYWKVRIWVTNDASDWSETASWQMGLLSTKDWSNARWIGFEDLPDSMRVVPGVSSDDQLGSKALKRPVIPLFRRGFQVNKKIVNASLFISGLGQYEVHINGSKIGNGFLTPGWTSYDKTILYNSYDVTKNLESGKNVIAAIVGNGFYNINRERYWKLIIAYGMPKMICRLKINYSDGSEENIITDSDWKTSPSAITFSSIFGGEDYDGRLEQNGWDKVGFDDSVWKYVALPTLPKGTLKADPDYPVVIAETFGVKNIQKIAPERYLYDFGQNVSGIVELKVKGKKGQKIKLIPGELLTKEKGINQKASGGPYYFSYILKGDGIEIWRPKFTYYGFRYVMVEDATPEDKQVPSNLPEVLSIELLHIRNSSPQNGSFECSNELFNQIHKLINYAIKSNLQSVVTDCPHREKLGWMEQTFLMGNSINYNFDIDHLYKKLVNDMMDSQLENGLVPDIAPELVEFSDGFRDSPEWGSASVILPWLVYKWYGDQSVMQKAWPMMVHYVEYLETKSNNQILSHGLGDWYDLGPKNPGPAQLTPRELTATAIYYYDLKLLGQMAGILKKDKEIIRFTDWSEKVKNAFNAKFLNTKTDVYSTGSQTAMSMPLSFGMVDEKIKAHVISNLADSIVADNKALTAGDIGFHYLVETLVKNGQSQLLFEMNARNDVPGYGFQLKRGATSLTESWAANEISSNNHLMLGHLMEWFYASLGGIRQEENSTAYKSIVIKPEIVGNLTSAKTSFKSPYGEIRSQWTKTGNSIILNLTIPSNTTALVYLPAQPGSLIREGKKNIAEVKDIQMIGEENGEKICRIGSGTYSFIIKN
jgi:alpha-L-rhamnosidase